MGIISRWGALPAAGLLVLGLAPYLPPHEYEARYILLALANEVPDGAFHFVAVDAATGDLDLGYTFETGQHQGSPTPFKHNFELAAGEWGPSHGLTSQLPSGYPGPYLEERNVRVDGGPFSVRLWEGVGVQKDCKATLNAAGLVPYRTTGGIQSWGPLFSPLHGRDRGGSVGAPADLWNRPQYLTCAWIEYTGGAPAGPADPLGVQVIAS